MIGNNSCGTHSVMGGKTVDNVLEMDVICYDGTRMTVGPGDSHAHRHRYYPLPIYIVLRYIRWP